jgi:hypothetical protein
MNENALEESKKLLKLALNNQSEEIHRRLSNLKGSSKYKGDVFEHFLAGLYNGIGGWKAVVTGGKDDKGVDILLYHPSSPLKVHTIIQAKNMKTPLSKKDLRHEITNFFGDDFSKGASEKHNCKRFIIISLNGYTRNHQEFTDPKTKKMTQVKLHCWAEVKDLIQEYSNPVHFRIKTKKVRRRQLSSKKVLIRGDKKSIFLLLITIFVFITVIFLFFRHNEENFLDYHVLTDKMIERLDETKLTDARKQDCQNLNYAIEICPQKLVYRYQDQYGDRSLKTGLIVYFCGQGFFKRGKCKNFENKALYVLRGW